MRVVPKGNFITNLIGYIDLFYNTDNEKSNEFRHLTFHECNE